MIIECRFSRESIPLAGRGERRRQGGSTQWRKPADQTWHGKKRKRGTKEHRGKITPHVRNTWAEQIRPKSGNGRKAGLKGRERPEECSLPKVATATEEQRKKGRGLGNEEIGHADQLYRLSTRKRTCKVTSARECPTENCVDFANQSPSRGGLD